MTTPAQPPGCPRLPEAGAYLLGSLTPAERADYAAHLTECLYCLREVGQLSGLPGLLARSPGPPSGARLSVPPERPGDEPRAVAEALAEIRRHKARRRSLLAAAFVLVAAAGAGVSTLAGGALATPATGVSAAAQLPVHMETVGGAKAWGELALAERPWGTEVVMRCRYEGNTGYATPVYVLVATDSDGATTELARWSAVPGQDVVLATATDLPRPRLASLEVRSTTGRVVLRTGQV